MPDRPSPAPRTATPARAWHALAGAEVLRALGSGDAGLAPAEAAARLARHGPNRLPTRGEPGPLRLLLRQLNDPISYLLLGSAAVALAVGEPRDGLVVLFAILLNALMGFLQEYRAGRAIAALARLVPEDAVVVRGGERLGAPAEALVPGDVVVLASGDRVPADARVLSARGLQVEEAALTGESAPVAKGPAAVAEDAPVADRRSVVHAGTHVASGTGTAVVVATGAATELGRISALLREVEPTATPLTRALASLGRWLTAAVLATAAALLAVGLWRGYGLTDGLLVAITIAVAAIPEGLPAIVTLSLAIGVQRMAARRALVRRLPSVETLGSTTVVCTDKTGTLTRGELTVRALWTPGGAAEGALLAAAALASDATLRREAGGWRVAGDPTEGALLVAAEAAGVEVGPLRRAWPRLDVLPFEPERQLMAALHRSPAGERVLFVKGAPEVVLARAGATPARAREAAAAEVERLAAGGLRVLAVAQRRIEAQDDPEPGALEDSGVAGLSLLGLCGMIDPPRPAAVAAVEACRRAGVRVKMITGDHRRTAEAIGAQLGLAGPALTGAELAALDEPALRAAALRTEVFARVAPEHKLRLVRALQAEGEVVAMTGDGVNDAPALRRADVGVAMGVTGTAVAKEASDIVLADDDFATLSAAVEEGRRIHDNLVKALAFVLPTNLGLALILVAAVTAFPLATVDGRLEPLLPALPTQLLWVNLIAAVTLSLPLAFERPEADVMRRPPRPPGAPIFGARLVVRTLVVATLVAAAALVVFLWEYRRELPGHGAAAALAEARTVAVTAVALFQVLYLFQCRSLRGSALAQGFFSNRAVFAGAGLLLCLQAGFVYLPFMQALFSTTALDLRSLATAAVAAAACLPVISLEKWAGSRLGKTGSRRARARSHR